MKLLPFAPRESLQIAAAVLAAVLGSVSLDAQQPPPRPPAQGAAAFATLVGTVYDSIHATPLVGATIKVEGSDRAVQAGEDGRFRLDSLPAGTYQFRLVHPLLDTLGVSLVTQPAPLAAGQTASLDLAIPSAPRIVELSCSEGRRALGPAAVVGRVLDADSDQPVVGARVSIVWSEMSLIDKLRKVPRVRESVTGEDGVYRICGLPGRLEGTVQGEHKGVKTGEVRITLGDQPLAFHSLKIGSANTVVAAAPGATPARTQPARDGSGRQLGAQPLLRGTAVLTGRVVNALGQPIVGARVDVTGTASAALTRENGEFTLGDLPSGTQELVVRQLGFAPVEKAVELSTRAPQRVTVTMSQPARVLETVEVKADRSAGLDKVGFTQRSKAGFGHFIGTEELDKRNAIRLTDVFRTVPGLRVVPSGNEYVVESSRGAMGGCVAYYLDGSIWQVHFAGDVDRMLPMTELGAVEIYNPSSVPAQFTSPNQSSCTTVVMWSKTRLGRR